MTALRRTRRDRGISLREAARALGCSASHLCALERGDAPMTFRRCLRAAALYGLRVEVLLARMGRPGRSRPAGRGGRPRPALRIGDEVVIVDGELAGMVGAVDKPAAESPEPGLVGVTSFGPVGSGLYRPDALRKLARS